MPREDPDAVAVLTKQLLEDGLARDVILSFQSYYPTLIHTSAYNIHLPAFRALHTSHTAVKMICFRGGDIAQLPTGESGSVGAWWSVLRSLGIACSDSGGRRGEADSTCRIHSERDWASAKRFWLGVGEGLSDMYVCMHSPIHT